MKTQLTLVKCPPKYIVTLTHLINQSLNTFEANAIYGDTCLHSTISDLKNKMGFRIDKKTESITNRVGRKTHVTRYTLHREDVKRAVNHIENHLKEKINPLKLGQ